MAIRILMESKAGQRTLRDHVPESKRTSEEVTVVRADCQQKGQRTDRCGDAESNPSPDFRATSATCDNPYRQDKKPGDYCCQRTNREYKSQRRAREKRPARALVVFAPQSEIDRGRCRRGGGDVIHVRAGDRKSTRLNSSHLGISYAVFCLKKKKSQQR